MRSPRICVFGIVLGFLFLVASTFANDNDAVDRGDARAKSTPNRGPIYTVEAGEKGEIYPVFANYASLLRQSDRSFGVVTVTIANHSDTCLRQRIAVKIVGWSAQELKSAH